jgi:hypothetical protein
MLKSLLKMFFPMFFVEPEKPKVAPTLVKKSDAPKKRGRPKGSKNKKKAS